MDQNCTLNSMKSTTLHFFHLKEDTINGIKKCLNSRVLKRRDSILIFVDEIRIINSLKNSNIYLDDDIYIIHNSVIHELYKVTIEGPLHYPSLGNFTDKGILDVEHKYKWKRRNNLEVHFINTS